LATGKATVQLYGVILSSLLEQTIPLSESMWYWDDILGSYVRTGLYMLQTSPMRFFSASKDIYHEAKSRYQSDFSIQDAAEESRQNLIDGWRQFYRLVQDSIRDRSLVQARGHILSPFALSRTEARHKQERLKKLREQSATAIGLLVDEGLAFPADPETQPEHIDWRSTVAKSVTILESLLHHSRSIEGSVGEYEYNVIETIDNAETEDQPSQLAARLLHILDAHLPQQESSTQAMATEYGMPSRWIRYWIPGVVLLLSGSTLLRIFANRRAEITTWIREAGQTSLDFWQNWVIEPTRRLIGTIRHDESTELAIMSKDSLRSDRESLERMVVDFAVENPENGRAYNETEIATIRAKVKEGDLTPVLRAYEQEMKSPVVRAVTGNLIRALLIQIQKTKVDVEVAIGGIDSLLKSQELLFGFVGVAPGILLSYFVLQWARGVFGGRRGVRQGQQKGEAIRLLRFVTSVSIERC
jgi:nuclear-control-of-ATPase protein 2